MDIKELQIASHAIAVSKGWWDDGEQIPGRIALIHSEVSAALEEWREHHEITEIRWEEEGEYAKPVGVGIAVADVLIRIADLCEGTGIDLNEALKLKNAYNAIRPWKQGGKKV